MAMATRMAMSDGGGLYRLMAWLSPSYPIGAFSYSHGFETAIEAGFVTDATSLEAWLCDIVTDGAGRNDGLFLKATYAAISRGDAAELREVAELAACFQPAAELALESTAQGQAFFDTTDACWPTSSLALLRRVWQGPLALPVAVGAAAAGHAIHLPDVLTGYLHAFAANLASAGIRLVPLGQTDGQRVIARLEPSAAETASGILATEKPLDHLAGNTFINDWCAMRHETQYTRLFRS